VGDPKLISVEVMEVIRSWYEEFKMTKLQCNIRICICIAMHFYSHESQIMKKSGHDEFGLASLMRGVLFVFSGMTSSKSKIRVRKNMRMERKHRLTDLLAKYALTAQIWKRITEKS
jgi:hypothetical protein